MSAVRPGWRKGPNASGTLTKRRNLVTSATVKRSLIALVFPSPELSQEEKENLAAVLDSFRSWAKETVRSHQLDHDGKFSDEVRQGMHELGMMGLNIPEEYGGFGASAMFCNGRFGAGGEVDLALAAYFGAHQSIGTPLIGMAQDGLAAFEPAYVDELATIMAWSFDYIHKGG